MDVLLFFLFILTTIALLKWFIKRKENFRYFEKHGIPGPKPSFWFGNGLELIKKGKQCELEWTQKYGDIFGFFAGAVPVLIVTDPELLRIIEVKKAQIFHKRNPIVPVAAVPNESFKLSTALNDGPVWKQARDMITPSYTTSKLKMLTNTINRVIDDSWKEMREIIKNGKNPDMKQIFSTMLADMSFQTALGLRIHDKENIAQSLNFAFDTNFVNPINLISACFPELKNLLYIIRSSTHTVKHFFSQPSILTVVQLCKDAISARLPMEKNVYADVLQQMVDTIFKRKEENVQKQTEKSGSGTSYDHTSLLTYTDCLSNSFYCAIATYDTIRNPMIFATYYIAKYPDIQQKMREEISQYNNKEENIDYVSLSKMKYVDQVFCEILRFHPPVASFTNRISEEDYKYKDIFIPRNTTIYVPQYSLHHNPKYWSEPGEFRPERFEDKSKIDPYIYQPFGIGPRHCLGMRPAQLIGKLILANLVKSFDFSLAPETKELEVVYDLVITHSMHPVYIKATPI